MRTYPRTYTRNLPDFLAAVADVPSASELEQATEIRNHFLFAGDGLPYMDDVVRAMRLVRGKKRYVEVGTYDKGCLGYVSTLLDSHAQMIDVDIEAREEHSNRLSAFIRPTQKLTTVVGDSTKASTLAAVRKALGGAPADCVFIDGNHAAGFAWADYSNFLELVAPGGLILFHDVYWQGTPEMYGVSHAMEWIDRAHPVHVVFARDPVHRFFPMFDRTTPVWGGVGIVRAAE